MISLRKINALLSKNMKTLTYNPFLVIGLLTTPLLAFFMGGDEPDGFFLSFMLQINILYAGINTMCILIAEEKEKHTLNVLKQSTVSGFDFLASNLIVTAVLTIAVNALIYFLLGFNEELLAFGPIMLISGAAVLPAAVAGAIIGIASKNQMTASTLVLPVFFLLGFTPVFFSDSPLAENIIRYTFSGQIEHGINAVYFGDSLLSNIGIIAANFAVLAVIFGLFYRKRGLS